MTIRAVSQQTKVFKQENNNRKPSTKYQMGGKLHEAKGAVKERVGTATNKPELAARGHDEKFAGKVQNKVGLVEEGT